jgi:hypothetical protein
MEGLLSNLVKHIDGDAINEGEKGYSGEVKCPYT